MSVADLPGLAEPLREEGVLVWVHEEEREAALDGGTDIPRRAFLHLWRPTVLRFLRAQMREGSDSDRPITEVTAFDGGDILAVPGQPEVVHTSGHNPGHCAFWLEDRTVLFAGDALQTMDPLTGRSVEPEPERAANFDDAKAKESAQRLGRFGQLTLLPGHGHPWEGDLGEVNTE